jgi:hypothetical protein
MRFASQELISKCFGILMSNPEAPSDITPSWNVAPQTLQPIIRLNPETGAKESGDQLHGPPNR